MTKHDQECDHQYVRLVAKEGGQLIPSLVSTCLKCGVLKVGTRTIKISKNRLDMGGKPITNASVITATELRGTVYYSDVCFQEKECAICNKKFKKKDNIVLWVRRVGRKGTALVPAHLKCANKAA